MKYPRLIAGIVRTNEQDFSLYSCLDLRKACWSHIPSDNIFVRKSVIHNGFQSITVPVVSGETLSQHPQLATGNHLQQETSDICRSVCYVGIMYQSVTVALRSPLIPFKTNKSQRGIKGPVQSSHPSQAFPKPSVSHLPPIRRRLPTSFRLFTSRPVLDRASPFL